MRLFERSSQGVTLTEAGTLLYSRAGELLSYADSTKQEVERFGRRRILRLGLTSSTVAPMIPFIAEYARRNPEASFEVHDGTTFSLFNSLLAGIIDVSVVRTPLRLDEVEHTVLCTEPMIAVSAPAEGTPRRGRAALSELTGRPLIVYRRYEKLITDAFAAHALEADFFCVCDDARGAVLWAKAGLATAILPASMSSLCTGLDIREIDEKALETQILLIWLKGKKPLPAVQDFIAVCRGESELSTPL